KQLGAEGTPEEVHEEGDSDSNNTSSILSRLSRKEEIQPDGRALAQEQLFDQQQFKPLYHQNKIPSSPSYTLPNKPSSPTNNEEEELARAIALSLQSETNEEEELARAIQLSLQPSNF